VCVCACVRVCVCVCVVCVCVNIPGFKGLGFRDQGLGFRV